MRGYEQEILPAVSAYELYVVWEEPEDSLAIDI